MLLQRHASVGAARCALSHWIFIDHGAAHRLLFVGGMHRLARFHLAPLFLFAIAACGPSVADDGDSEVPASPDAGVEQPEPEENPDPNSAAGCEKMDIVFVIDDSASMQEEQDNLIANFPGFIEVLADYQTRDGSYLDYRVAVTTTGLDVNVGYSLGSFVEWEYGNGLDGAFVEDTDCGMNDSWISGDSPSAESTFSCAAAVGTSGPSIEMPLEALRRAFTDRISDGSNTGFHRDDALLAFVVLTDEDDCSRSDNNFLYDCSEEKVNKTSSYIEFFDTLQGGRDRWTAAIIAGTGQENCESDFGEAYPAERLMQFASEAGDNVVTSSICDGDLAASLAEALHGFGDACEKFPSID